MKKAALIGAGMVADTHLAALRDASGVSLSSVLGRDPSKTQKFADKASAVTGDTIAVYKDLSALIADAQFDFAILATPPDARQSYVEALTQAGKPILMEKPIERNLAAAEQIVHLCESAGVPLGMVFQHRARAASIALKEAIDKGALGQIVSAEVRVPWWRDQRYYDMPGRGTHARDGGGVMITQAIHTLDLVLWLLGPFARVLATLKTTALHRMESEDWAGVFFETHDGCVGSMMATTAAYPGGPESISLHGTLASAQLEAGTVRISYHDGRTETLGETAETGGGANPMAFTHAWHQTVIEDFAASLTNTNPPLASGKNALMSHAVIDAMERSHLKKTWVEVKTV